MKIPHFLRLPLLSLAVGLAVVACQSGDPGVGQQIITPRELDIQVIDTITVQTATVLADSFFTYNDNNVLPSTVLSGLNNVLVGRWNDPQTGRTQAKGFTSIGYTANTLPTQTGLIYDSLVLVLPVSFAYGDTTGSFTLNVHRLTGLLKNRAYSNLSSIDYEPVPYLSKTVPSGPFTSNRQYRFRLPSAMQQDFVNRLTNRTIENQEGLDGYLKGFAFVASPTANVFVGLNMLASSGAGLTLYYHTTDIAQTNSVLSFPLRTQDLQVSTSHFSQVLTDRTGTPLAGLKNRSDAISSTLTNNQVFVVPSAQLTTRLTIPTFDKYALGGNQFRGVNRAELVMEPILGSNRSNTAPFGGLYLYQTNTNNQLIDINGDLLGGVTTGVSETVSAPLLNYRPFDLIPQPQYRFNMTYYVNEILAGRLLNRPLLLTTAPVNHRGLQQSVPLPTLASLAQRITIGNARNQQYRLRLELFVTTEK